MLLSDLPPHLPAVVTAVTLPKDASEKLAAYGLRAGAPVTAECVAPLGSLIAYRVYGTLIALRPKTAAGITVKTRPL